MASTPPPEIILRSRYLGFRQGAANIGWLLLMDGLLLGWLWYGRTLLPYGTFIGLSVLGCLIHQRILSEWFHEATHWNLLPHHRLNDVLADLLIGTFNGTRVKSNRPGHFRHHAVTEFFLADDPDTRALNADSRAVLLEGILRDLAGISAVQAYLLAAGAGGRRVSAVGRAGWFAWLAVLHGAGLAITITHGRSDMYPLYFLTLLSLYPVANRFRLYGQHAELRADGSVRLGGSRTSRTFRAGLIEQLLINSPMIMYHYEHHARPSLPYRALRAIAQPSADPNVNGTSSFRIAAAVLRRPGG